MFENAADRYAAARSQSRRAEHYADRPSQILGLIDNPQAQA